MNNKPQIFFLHFAGGNCFSYDFLLPQLNNFDIHALELPGRGKRVTEKLVANFNQAIDDYFQQIIQRRNRAPFMIFGHSMGATIAAHLISRLEQHNFFPEKVILSGNAGPGVGAKKERHLLTKDAFLKELKEIGGMPEEFFKHSDLIDYYMPILRSDFRIVEEITDQDVIPFQTPILALMGSKEEDVGSINNWSQYTTSGFEKVVLPGNHFFIHQHVENIVQYIKSCFYQMNSLRTT